MKLFHLIKKAVGAQMIKLRSRGNLNINGDIVAGQNISIQTINGKTTILVDGKQVAWPENEINITIEGDVESVNIPACNSLHVSGNATRINSVSGDVQVGGKADSVHTVSGDVSCDHADRVNTVSGDILQNKYKDR